MTRTGLQAMTRNHWFHGQLLGVEHLDRERAYATGHRRQLTRTVLGTGVVCGLDVDLDDAGTAVVVGPGLAVDLWGQEVVVPVATGPIPIPQEVRAEAAEHADGCSHDPTVQVVLCYHECPTGPPPEPECGDPDPCAPATVREQFRIEFRPRPAPARDPRPSRPELVRRGRIDHAELAEWVTRARPGCTTLPADPCLVLANVELDDDHCGRPDRVDITVRKVLLSNVVLAELLMAALAGGATTTTSYSE